MVPADNPSERSRKTDDFEVTQFGSSGRRSGPAGAVLAVDVVLVAVVATVLVLGQG